MKVMFNYFQWSDIYIAQVISDKLMEGKANSPMIWCRSDIILNSNEELQDTRVLQLLQSSSFGVTINFPSWVTRWVAESGFDMSAFKTIYFAFKMQMCPSLSSWFSTYWSQWKHSHRFWRNNNSAAAIPDQWPNGKWTGTEPWPTLTYLCNSKLVVESRVF